MRPKDLKGNRYGKLIVEELKGSNANGERMWICKCDCGNTSIVRASALTTGKTTSCGCYKKICNIKHGEANNETGKRTRLYSIWSCMTQRCTNNNTKAYKNYGGRGIKVCEEWHSYEAFKEWALKNGYSKTLTIDRIDNNGNYCPSNCKWSTRKEQSNNTRRNDLYTIDNETYNLTQLSELCGINVKTLWTRVKKLGWNIEMAISTPIKGISL